MKSEPKNQKDPFSKIKTADSPSIKKSSIENLKKFDANTLSVIAEAEEAYKNAPDILFPGHTPNESDSDLSSKGSEFSQNS